MIKPEVRFPLLWPTGWSRTRSTRRAPFKVEPSKARKEMLAELERLGASKVIITTNQPVNRDGSLSMARRIIFDMGVAIYFKRNGRDTVLACDQYWEIHDNIRAIGKTIEAMRGIERWGASDMLDRAFTGFEALPPPEEWWRVLGVSPAATREDIRLAYRELAKGAHPDAGGTDAALMRILNARDAGFRERPQ
jgi:hypothetical protein